MAGGVSNWKDAIELILCGANLVGVCTEILLNGYDIVRPMIKGVAEYMEKHGYKDFSEFRGMIVPQVKTAQEVTLYDGYAQVKEPNLSAPCKVVCPNNAPVQAYVRMIAKKNFKRAYELIMSKPECASDCKRLCEKACLRGRIGRPLQIQDLKNFVLDYAKKQGWYIASQAAGKGNKTVLTNAELVLHRSGYYKDGEAVSILTEQDAVAEASRCLNCGCGEGCQHCKTICCIFAAEIADDGTMRIDKDECVACGMCYYGCPNKNIEMVKLSLTQHQSGV
jgi:Pyruvate/2-oxoacid:ferredoxin oxidoreductase delta subunit